MSGGIALIVLGVGFFFISKVMGDQAEDARKTNSHHTYITGRFRAFLGYLAFGALSIVGGIFLIMR